MIIDMFFETAEEAVPLERRLAFARQQRKEILTKGIDDASKLGEYAGELAQQRAELLVMYNNTIEDIKETKRLALQAQNSNNTEQEAVQNADAARLANEAAEIQTEIQVLDQDIETAYRDFHQAKDMIVELSRDIQRQSRDDMRLVAKVARTDLKEKMLSIRESMLGLTSTRDSAAALRARAVEQAEAKENRIQARSEVVAALWEEHRGSRVAEAREISAAGASIIADVERELGYTPKPALPEGQAR
jgi:hypothetical protein